MPDIPGIGIQCGDCEITRGRPSVKWDRLERHVDTIIDLHDDGWSASWLAQLFAVGPTLMLNFLKAHHIKPRRKNLQQEGAGHWRWNGGRSSTRQGYVRITLSPNDPLFTMCERARPYVLEHRYIMAQALGRPLRKDETVHHKNGDKADNRLENLQLMIGTHHAGVSLCCADCGSYNIVHQEIG